MSSVSCYPPTCKENLLILFKLREGHLYLGEGFEWCAFTLAPHKLNFPSAEAASKNTLTRQMAQTRSDGLPWDQIITKTGLSIWRHYTMNQVPFLSFKLRRARRGKE